MDLMADAVARTGETDAMLFGYGLDITVVVGIFKACLQGVVVDISNGKLSLDTFRAHCFKLKVCHRTCGILCESLIDAKSDLGTRDHFARNKVIFDDFLCNGVSHDSLLFNQWMYFQWL